MYTQPSVARRTVRALVSVVAALAMTFTGVTVASAATTPTDSPQGTASISGTVTDAVTADGIADATVLVLDADGTELGSAVTGSTGGYTVSELDPGQYYVSVSAASDYVSDATAQSIVLIAAEARTGADFALSPAENGAGVSDDVATTSGDAPAEVSDAPTASPLAQRAPVETGKFSGTVTDGDGNPVEGIWAYASSYWDYVETKTGSDGRYELEVPPGLYDVWFVSYELPFLSQYWEGAHDSSDRTPLTVSAGDELTGIDAKLMRAATISGVVTRADDGAPVAHTYVRADRGGNSLGAYTNAEGEYTIEDAVPGDYTLSFQPNDVSNLISEYWDGAMTLSDATVVHVAEGQKIDDINASLDATVNITGTVSADTSVVADVTAYRWSGDSWDEVRRVTASGDYTFASGYISGGSIYTLPEGKYTVGFSAPGYCTQYWDGKSALEGADSFTLTATDRERSGIDASLEQNCEDASMVPGTPTITGLAQAGQTLTAAPGTWDPADAALSYQWFAGTTAIAGATGETFVLGNEQVGAMLSVRVTGTKPGYTDATATSASFGPIEAATLLDLTPGTPTISGTPSVGETLTVTSGTWGPAPVALAYQWYRGDAVVPGATSATLTLTAADLGERMTVVVRGTKPGYNPANRSAEATDPVAAGTLTAATPTLAGAPQVGQPFAANTGTWGPAPVDLAYRWFADGALIAGSTGATIVPTAAQLGAVLSVEVTGSKSGYASESRVSNDSAPVEPSVRVDDTTPAAGATITITGQGFEPGETVRLELHSTPVVLGTVKVAPNGTFTAQVRIPAGTAPGAHTIYAFGLTSNTVTATPITVVAASPSPSSSGTGGLAVTGGDVPWNQLGGAALLLLVGGVLLYRRQRSAL
ncbi:carboxypeptidase regulatory-like domain-containing protein [Microbacterium sp.]|uniref:carboxypeptidase regulatory-like domain-containing protein n=1 Tax=Microbacterium sp. TaxID=51671 RepID=UPI003A91D389